MKKIIESLLCICMMLSITTGCATKTDKTKKTIKVVEKSKGNYDVFESIKKININSSIEEINKLIGFNGTEKANKTYIWQLSPNTSIEVIYYEGIDNVSVKANFKDDMIINAKVDFSKVNEMKTKLNTEQGLTYKDVVNLLGDEGILKEKTSTVNTYKWVNEKGNLTASFSTVSGKCISYNGMF